MQLNDKLKNLSTYPFHMPGHKRNSLLCLTGADIDITEIDGFDNLHSPTAVLRGLEENIAMLFGVKKSIISVNGSTCGILAAISALCNRGDKIIIARNCHKSVYNACFINELDVHYIEPEYEISFSCWGRITQNSVDKAVKACPDACAIVITSPTYEGYVSSIKCSIPLIVDGAHGAHFSFADWLPERPDADIIIESLHKTLPSLTQTAVVHINNPAYFAEVKKYMDIYETSSPSYVLLSSVDKCADFLVNSEKAFSDYKKRLDAFYKAAGKIYGIDILKNDDSTRLILSAAGYSGSELAGLLRKSGIEPEGTALNYVILISTVADTDRGFELLLSALSSIEKNDSVQLHIDKPPLPEKRFNSYEIKNSAETLLSNSVGKISAEYIYAYPPGSPIITPGEVVTADTANYIKKLLDNHINLLSDSSLLPLKILTKA